MLSNGGVVRLNKPETDHRYWLPGVPTGGGTGRHETVTMRITYGKAYVAGVYGIEVKTDFYDNANPLLAYYEVTLTIPSAWGTSVTVLGPFAGAVGPITDMLKIVEQILFVDRECNALHEFTELYLEIEGVNVFTLGSPVSESFSGFDRRNVQCYFLPTPDPDAAPSAAPACGSSTFAGETTFDHAWDPEILDAGWEWQEGGAGSWIRDDIAIDNAFGPPDVGCDCEYALEVIGSAGDDKSMEFSLGAPGSFVRTKTLLASGTQVCDDGSFDWEKWRVDQVYMQLGANIGAAPRDWGIVPHQRTVEATCNGVTTSPDDTVIDEIVTYCETQRTAYKSVGSRECGTPIPIGCPPPYTLATPTFCEYVGYARIFWPEAPPCLEGKKSPTYDINFSNRHYPGYVDIETGTFWAGRGDNSTTTAWDFLDSEIDAEWACMRCDRQDKGSPLYVWIESGGSIDRYKSTTEGKTWGSGTAVFSGTSPAAVIGRHGIQYIYGVYDSGGSVFKVRGQQWDRAGNVIEASFDALSGVDEFGRIAVDEFVNAKGKHQIALWVVIGGVLKVAFSDDGKVFGSPITVLDGETPAAIYGRHGMGYMYGVYDSGSGVFKVRGQQWDRSQNVLETSFDAVSGVDEDAGIAVDEFVTSGGKHQIRLWTIEGGEMTPHLSDNGKVFA